MMLIGWLRDHDMRKFNARETRRTIGGILRQSTHMNAACKALEGAGLIRPAFSRAGESKGQRRKDYEVNPVARHQNSDSLKGRRVCRCVVKTARQVRGLNENKRLVGRLVKQIA